MKNNQQEKFIPYSLGWICLSLYALSGCTLTTEKWDAQFGTTTRLNMEQQIIDPLAGSKPNAGYALDGRVAKEILTRYQNSYKDPAPESNNFTIGVGK